MFICRFSSLAQRRLDWQQSQPMLRWLDSMSHEFLLQSR